MGEIKTLKSYLDALKRGVDPKVITPVRPVFVTKVKSDAQQGNATEPLKPLDSQTLVIRPKPAYENPWDDVSVLLVGNPVNGRYVVGRLAGCALTIPHKSVSKEHAYLYQSRERWMLRDDLSTNGTGISQFGEGLEDSLPKGKEVELPDSWLVRFGSARTEFYLPDSFVRYVKNMQGTYNNRERPK